jgi:hypothetical protein
MKKISFPAAALIAAMSFITVSAQNATPKAAAQAFYRFDRTHSQVFDRANINARRQWLSSELYSLLINELKRDAEYLKKNPGDKPFFGDGLPFQPLQEDCEAGKRRGLVIRQEFQRGARAAVTATFAYPKPCSEAEPVVYTIGMIRGKSGWVIDDINYGEDTTLKQRLKRKEY